MSVEHVTTLEEINLAINTKNVVLLTVSAESWCVPCRALAPHYDGLAAAEEFAGKDVAFLKVDLDSHPEIAQEFGVMGVPTVLAFKRGHRVENISARTVVKLKSEVQALLDS